MKIRPLGDRAIVKRLESETKTAGGILIPDSATEKPSKGKILAVGPGKSIKGGKHRPLAVKVGDVVLFGKYSGTEFKEGKDEFVVLREEDIIGILDEK
jgi:chaperonin GroES